MVTRTIVVVNLCWMHYNATFNRVMTRLFVFFPQKSLLVLQPVRGAE